MTARLKMTPEESFWAIAPYIYAPSTPRTRLEEDLAVRLRTYPSSEGYFAQLQGAGAWTGAYSRLPNLKIPTLVIQGNKDQLAPPENANVLAQAIPDAALILLQDASHLFFTDQLEAASEAVLSFLDRV